jgi:uncharacterized protein (DUF433 family)
MVAVATDSLLGKGLYTPPEAAFYARIRTQTFNRWLYGNKSGDRVITPERGEGAKAVSFLDFVQSLTIRSITNFASENRVPLQKLREAVEEARQRYGVEHPLAMQHKTFVFGNQIVIKAYEDDYRVLTGHSKGNKLITPVVELHMRKLTFNSQGLAESYCAWGDGDTKIVMDPHVRFGEPMFPGLGYTARTLWEAVPIEGGIEAVAEIYGVPSDAVMASCDYFDHLQGSAAGD